MKSTILVLGATGLMGQPVVHYLNECGYQVRIMTRAPQKAQPVFRDSVEIAAGDPTDIHCLEETLDGCDGVHISLPTEVEQQVAQAVAKVSSKHGVKRITYISGASVSEEHRWFPMINRKFLAEEALRDGNTPWTIFCPTWVMESLALFAVQGRASVLGKQPCPYRWVAAEDCARMVTTAYQLEEAANKRFILFGPEGIPMQEALKRYCAVFHPDIKKVSTMPFWLVNLLVIVTRDQGLKNAGAMMAYFDKVGEQGAPADDPSILGAPAITLDKWLAGRKASLGDRLS